MARVTILGTVREVCFPKGDHIFGKVNPLLTQVGGKILPSLGRNLGLSRLYSERLL